MDIELLNKRVDEWTRYSYAFKKPPYSMKMLREVRVTHQRMLMVLNEMANELDKKLDVSNLKKTEGILQLNSKLKELSKQYEVLEKTILEALETKQQKKA